MVSSGWCPNYYLKGFDLFNGNIANMVTTITNPNTRAVLPLGNAYKYDQLNRLKEARSYNNINLAGNTWNSGGTAMYYNQFNYDANGNIIYQLRMDDVNAPIDDMSYYYEDLNGAIDSKNLNPGMKVKRNRLRYVRDVTDYDANDINPAMSSTNYVYDAEGRLVKDGQENINLITWRVDGKVKKIERPAGSSLKNLIFDYESQLLLVKEERFCWKAKTARGKWGTESLNTCTVQTTSGKSLRTMCWMHRETPCLFTSMHWTM